MKVLVTGANGQLGSEIKARSEQFPGIEFLFTDVNDLDLTDFESVRAYCEQNKPSFIVNCAAYTAVDVAETDVDLATLINTKVPAFLGKVATETGAKIIHISTDYVFDGTACMPYQEADLVDPDSVYGKTKLNGEIALVKEEPKAIIIRTSWLYSGFGKNFVKTMIKLGVERDELKVVVDQVGTPTFAGDLAEAILASRGRCFFVEGWYLSLLQ
jgi:dTDP-4-dehydrorhamnose reductase